MEKNIYLQLMWAFGDNMLMRCPADPHMSVTVMQDKQSF